jgi:predicted transcriptional regulator
MHAEVVSFSKNTGGWLQSGFSQASLAARRLLGPRSHVSANLLATNSSGKLDPMLSSVANTMTLYSECQFLRSS